MNSDKAWMSDWSFLVGDKTASAVNDQGLNGWIDRNSGKITAASDAAKPNLDAWWTKADAMSAATAAWHTYHGTNKTDLSTNQAYSPASKTSSTGAT